MTYKYRVKRPNGTFTDAFDTPSEAVACAADYVNIPWKEGVEAIARLDKGLTSIHIFKDPITGDFCGVDRVEVEEEITYLLTIQFRDEQDRDRAQAILREQFECTVRASNYQNHQSLLA